MLVDLGLDKYTWLLETSGFECLTGLNATGLSGGSRKPRSSVAALALAPWLRRITSGRGILWSAWWSTEWVSVVNVEVLALGLIKVGPLEHGVGSVDLLWSTSVVWNISESGLTLSQGPLWGESLLGSWKFGEALGVVAEPEEELEVLGGALDPLHVVHEVTNSAWLCGIRSVIKCMSQGWSLLGKFLR